MKDLIRDKIGEAMKSGNNSMRDALRFLLSRIQQWEVDNKTPVTSDTCIDVIKKLIKQNKETLEFGENEKVRQEIEIWSSFLPKQLTEEETRSIVVKLATENGVSNIKQMGKLIGIIKQNYGANVEMSLVSRIAKEILSN